MPRLARHPQVCVSSYQYALRTNESWMRKPVAELHGRSYQQHYRETPARQGVQTECRRCFKELRQAANLFEASATRPATLTIHYEQVEANFEAAVRRVFSFAGAEGGGDARARARFEQLLGVMRKHDLSRRAPNAQTKEAGHVSNSSQKAGLRAMLLDSAFAPELQRLRQRLGYAGREGTAASAAIGRQWMLNSLARPSP